MCIASGLKKVIQCELRCYTRICELEDRTRCQASGRRQTVDGVIKEFKSVSRRSEHANDTTA